VNPTAVENETPPNPGGTLLHHQLGGRTPSKTRFVVLIWLCAAAALAYVSRNAISVAESTVRRDLALTKEQSGWLMSAFFFSYALCQIPTAQLGQRSGPRFALPLFALVWSAATALTAFVSTLATMIIARTVQGIAQAGLFPTATGTIARWFPKTGRAFATGALGSFMSVGGALCAWLTGILLELFDPHVAPGWNWRLTFLLFALPGLLWAFFFWRWFRDDPAAHPGVNEAELELIRGVPEPVGLAQRVANPLPTATPWVSLITSPALWCICGQQVFRAAGYMFFTSWFATYLQETRGVSIAKSGFLNMLPLLAVVAGGFVGGALSDRLLKWSGSRNVARRWLSIASLLTCAGFIFWALIIEDAVAAVLVITAGSFVAALAAPSAYAVTIDMGGQHVPTVNATMNMMGNLGAWSFPIAVPLLLARFGSWDAVVVVFGALYVVAACFWLMLKPEGTVFEQTFITSLKPKTKGRN
jgi:MFS transporter, ACS family, D-galactonate transporter